MVQFNAGLSYTIPVSADSSVNVRGDVTHRGSTNSQARVGSPFNVPLAAYDIVNARVNWDWKAWEFSLFAKNLSDRRAQVDAISSSQDPLARITVRPLTAGMSVNYKF